MAQNIGYVGCDECGHPIEEHSAKGCTHLVGGEYPCQCTQRFTQADIRRLRQQEGLPAKYNPLDF